MFSADVLLTHHLGIEGDVAWRASQNLYGGYQPYRPIFYSFNAIWAPKIATHITAELLAGIGGENLRFYTPYTTCSYITGCTDYVTSNHFMGDFGGGIRAYVWRSAFIRPEVRLYLINNNVEFSSSYAVRYGVSLGYSFVDGSWPTSVEANRQGEEERGQHLGRGSVTLGHSYPIG